MGNNRLLRSLTQARTLAGRLKGAGKKIVFTNGCFDILHAGHAEILAKAKALGDILIVGVNSDASVRRLKGAGRPVVNLKHRMRLLSALRCVDYAVAFAEPTPMKLIEAIRPDVLVKGADWTAGAIVGREHAKKIARIKLVRGLSTTAIINKIRSGR